MRSIMSEESTENTSNDTHDKRQREAEPKFNDRSYASKKFRDFREPEFRGNGDEHFVAQEYRQAPVAGSARDFTGTASPNGDAGVGKYPRNGADYGHHTEDEEHRYRRPDSSIFAALSMALSDDATIDAHDVRISVNEGVVTLQGRVDSEYSKNVITEIAADISGVRRVEDDLLETDDDEEYVGSSQHSGNTGIKRSLLEKE